MLVLLHSTQFPVTWKNDDKQRPECIVHYSAPCRGPLVLNRFLWMTLFRDVGVDMRHGRLERGCVKSVLQSARETSQ